MLEQSPKHFAHSLAGRPPEEWHGLQKHLTDTAELAESFAHTYAEGWGRLAGMWHDAGKYQRAFQLRIGADPDIHVNERVDHSTVGALIAKNRALSFVIAGHHGGLANSEALSARLMDTEKRDLLIQARKDGLPQSLEEQPQAAIPSWMRDAGDSASFSMWTRFLFSALVDADFLDTERFYAGGVDRDLGARPNLAELKQRMDEYLSRKTAGAKQTPINEMRARVLSACREKAKAGPGVFTLTVPTGGGKTLASLAFALGHAVRNEKSRIIVVIPFTSIIEQTAAVYREALGDQAVIEHHSNVDPGKETPTKRLMSENWDAPVVVTTSVQFFESLFANRTSKCRKLHRIANSVVVFDEVQTFPVKLLAPVKYALRELTARYGATLVMCTATQPMLLDNAVEILPQLENDVESEFAVVRGRCEMLMPQTEDRVTWEALAEELRSHQRVMAIVHRRDDAQELAKLVGDCCLHLSARMCPIHRTAVLAEVKRRLQAGEPCRLVATQLVEAGVDIDFPEVYRAFAGADSMAQAAGRCNREGKGKGRLHIFMPPTQPPSGILRTAESIARAMWREHSLDLTAPATFRDYFSRLYGMAEQDGPGVMAAERSQRFADVADLFKMIPESGQAVVAPYGDWQVRVDAIRCNGISRDRMRRLQPVIVNLYQKEIDTLNAAGALERVADAFWTVNPGFPVYSPQWGFGWQGPLAAEPEGLIA